VSTKATIDALVGEGFNAARTLRDHVKRSADMISAEYAGDTLRQAQLPKALAERLFATPDLGTEQQTEDQVRKAIIGLLQTFFDMLKGPQGPVHERGVPAVTSLRLRHPAAHSQLLSLQGQGARLTGQSGRRHRRGVDR
jgi:hypothetical protein